VDLIGDQFADDQFGGERRLFQAPVRKLARCEIAGAADLGEISGKVPHGDIREIEFLSAENSGIVRPRRGSTREIVAGMPVTARWLSRHCPPARTSASRRPRTVRAPTGVLSPALAASAGSSAMFCFGLMRMALGWIPCVLV
jgi:hypothetical protein